MQLGNFLIAILLLATFGVLIAGVVLMSFGGRANAKYAGRLMSWRVTLQGLAIMMLVLLFTITR